jgi:C1A family cysteine protease
MSPLAHFDYLGWMAKFNREITDVAEFMMRLEKFTETHNWIEQHNASGASWKAGHNQFSDWTAAEFKRMTGRVEIPFEERAAPTILPETNADTVNWVTTGAVTAVKDQGSCGSCWAFSTTGSLEGAHWVQTGSLLSFSEQQLVDCAGLNDGYQNMACHGGLQSYAYAYYMDGHDAMLETDYAYESGRTLVSSTCKYDAAQTSGVTVTSYTDITPNNPAQMKAGLAQAPLAVAIEADQRVFQTYSSGILDSSACGTTLDHAVLAVGYGSEAGQDYWLVKNSWNTTWGDNGYIKIAMTGNDAGICGVQNDPQLVHTN